MRTTHFTKLFSLFILIGFSFHQNSLSSQIIKDTIDIKSYMDNAGSLFRSNQDSAFKLINELKKIKINEKDILQISGVYTEEGNLLIESGKYKEAEISYKKGLELAQKTNDSLLINTAQLALSTVYLYLSYHNIAKKYLIPALKYFEKADNMEGITGAALNLTFIDMEQKEYESSLYYSKLAYRYGKRGSNKSFYNKAIVNMGAVYSLLQKYDSSLFYSYEALDYAKESKDRSILPIVYINLGDSYSARNEFDSALYYYNRTLNIPVKNTYIHSVCNKGIALLYKQKKDYKKALEYANTAYQLADNSKLLLTQSEIANLLAELYSKLKQYDQAFYYKNIESLLDDSLYTTQKYKERKELEMIYESQKKEKQISQLANEMMVVKAREKQSRILLVTAIIIFILLLAGGAFVSISIRLKSQKSTIELEQRLLRSQLNPHFIFNATSAIQDFIMKKDPMLASAYLSDFSMLMRTVLKSSVNSEIALKDEIEYIDKFLKLQQLRFSPAFSYSINVDEDIDLECTLVPPMLAQPFIENAIIHGISKEPGKGEISINVGLNKNIMNIDILDNGIGYNQKSKNISKHKSLSIEITKHRINNFKKSFKNRISFDIIDLSEHGLQTGTKVSFKLPLVTDY